MSQVRIRIGFRYTSVQIPSIKRNWVENILVSLFTPAETQFFLQEKNIHLVVLMKSKGKRIRSLIILIGDIDLLGESNKSWGLVR